MGTKQHDEYQLQFQGLLHMSPMRLGFQLQPSLLGSRSDGHIVSEPLKILGQVVVQSDRCEVQIG